MSGYNYNNNWRRRERDSGPQRNRSGQSSNFWSGNHYDNYHNFNQYQFPQGGSGSGGGGGFSQQWSSWNSQSQYGSSYGKDSAPTTTSSHSTSRHSFGSSQSHSKTSGHTSHRSQSPLSESRGRHGHERHSSLQRSQSPVLESRNRQSHHSSERHSSSSSSSPYKSHHHSKKSVSPPLGSEEARKKSLAQTTDKIKSCLLSFKSEKSEVLENLLSKNIEKKKDESIKSKSKRLEKQSCVSELKLTTSDLKVIGKVNTTGSAAASESEDGICEVATKSESASKGNWTSSSVPSEEQNSYTKSSKGSANNEDSKHQATRRGSQSNSKRTKSSSETSSSERLPTAHNDDASVNIPSARTRSTSLNTPCNINNRNGSSGSDNSSKQSVRSIQNQPKETLKYLKDRIMQQFIKMSKNNLKDLIDNPRSRKFEFAMNSLMKEHRLILSRELRGLAQSRIRGADVENPAQDVENLGQREPTFERLSLSDPDIAINLSHLPQEVIEKLGSLLQLDLLDSAENVDFQPNISAEDESSVHDLQNIQALQVALLSEENIKREIQEDVKPELQDLINEMNEQNTLETDTNVSHQDDNINLQEQHSLTDVQAESNTENVEIERGEQQIVYEEGGAAKKARPRPDIWSPYIPLGRGFMNRSGEFGNLFCEFPDFMGIGSSETETDAVDDQENNGPEMTDSGQTVHVHENEDEMSGETTNQQIISNETGEIEQPSSSGGNEDPTLDVDMASAEILNDEPSDNCADIVNRTEKAAGEEIHTLEGNVHEQSDGVISNENQESTNQNEENLSLNNIDSGFQTINKENDISSMDSKENNIDDCIKRLEEACAKIENSTVCSEENNEEMNYENASPVPTDSRIQAAEEYPAECLNTGDVCVGESVEEPEQPEGNCATVGDIDPVMNKSREAILTQDTESCHIEQDKTDTYNMEIDTPNENMEVDENSVYESEEIACGENIIQSMNETDNCSSVMETEIEDKTEHEDQLQEVVKNVEPDKVEDLESNAAPAIVSKEKEVNSFREAETDDITVDDLYGDLSDFCNVDEVDNSSVNVVSTENCVTGSEVATSVVESNSEVPVTETEVNVNDGESNSVRSDPASNDDAETTAAGLQVEVPDIQAEEDEVTEIYRCNVLIKTEKADETTEPMTMPDEELQHEINNEPEGDADVRNMNILSQPSSVCGTMESQQMDSGTQTEPPDELDTNDIQRMLQLLEKSSQLSPQLAKLLKNHFSSTRGTEENEPLKFSSSSMDKTLSTAVLREKSPSFLSTISPRALVHVPDSHDMDLAVGPASSFSVDGADSSFRAPHLLTNRGKRNYPRKGKTSNRIDVQETNLDSGISQKDDSRNKGTDVSGLESGNLRAEVSNSGCLNEDSPLSMRMDLRTPVGMSTRYVYMKMLEIDKEIQRLMEVKLELYRKLQFNFEGDSPYPNRSGNHSPKSRILQYISPAAKEVTGGAVPSQNLSGRSELQNNSSAQELHMGFQSVANNEMVGSSFPNDKTTSASTPMVMLPMDFVLGPSGQHSPLPRPKLNERLKTFDTSIVEAVLNSFNIPDNNTKGDETLSSKPMDESIQNKSAVDDDARQEPGDNNRSRRSVSSRLATPSKEQQQLEKMSPSKNVTPKKQSQRQKHEPNKELGTVDKKKSGIATRNKSSTPLKSQTNISCSPVRRSSRSETSRPTKDLRNTKQVDGLEIENTTDKNTRSSRQKQTQAKGGEETLQSDTNNSVSEEKGTRNRRQTQAKGDEETSQSDTNNSVSEEKGTRKKRQTQAKGDEETSQSDINNSVSEEKGTRNRRQTQAKGDEETLQSDINNSISEEKGTRNRRQPQAKGDEETSHCDTNNSVSEEKGTRNRKQTQTKGDEETSDNNSSVFEEKGTRNRKQTQTKGDEETSDINSSVFEEKGTRNRKQTQTKGDEETSDINSSVFEEKGTRNRKQTQTKGDEETSDINSSVIEEKGTRNRKQTQTKGDEETSDINSSVFEEKGTRNRKQTQTKGDEETSDINSSVSEEKGTRNRRQAKGEEETLQSDTNNSISGEKGTRNKRQKNAHVKTSEGDSLQPEHSNLIDEKSTRHSRQKQSCSKPEEELSQADINSVVEEKKERRQSSKSKSRNEKHLENENVTSGSRSRRTAQNKAEGSEIVSSLPRNKKETRTKPNKETELSEELMDLHKKETRSSKRQNSATAEELDISDENSSKVKRKRKISAKADLSESEQTEENLLEESDKTTAQTRSRRCARVSSEQQDSQTTPTSESSADTNKKKKKVKGEVTPQVVAQKESVEENTPVPKKATRTSSSSSQGQTQNIEILKEGPLLEHAPDAVVQQSPSKNRRHLNGAQKRKLEEAEGPPSKLPRLNPKPDLLQWKLQDCFVMVKPLSLGSVSDSKQPESTTSEPADVNTRVRRSSTSSDDLPIIGVPNKGKKKGKNKEESCVRVDIPETSDELLDLLESNDNQQDPLGGIPDTHQPPELQAEPYVTINSSPMQLPPDLIIQSNSPGRLQCLLPEIAMQDENSISTLVSDTISVMSDGEQSLPTKKRSDEKNETDLFAQSADGRDDCDRDSTYSYDTAQESREGTSSRASKHKSSRKHKKDRRTDGIERLAFEAHQGPILDIKTVGRHVLAASDDGNVYCYSLKSGKFKRKYEGHSAAVTCLSVSEFASSSSASDTEGPDGEQIAPDLFFTGSLDKHLRHFSFKTGELVQNPVNVGSPIQCMDQNWGFVYIGTKSGEVVNYNIKNATLAEPIRIGRDAVLTLKATKEGPRQVLIVGTRNKPISVRDASSGLLLRNICNNWSHTVYSLVLDTSVVYFGTKSGTIPAVEFTSGDEICRYQAGAGVVCMRKYNNLLFAGCYDGNIYVFSIPDQKQVSCIPGPGKMMLCMDIVKNRIIAGSKDSNKLEAWGFPQEIRNHLKESKHR